MEYGLGGPRGGRQRRRRRGEGRRRPRPRPGGSRASRRAWPQRGGVEGGVATARRQEAWPRREGVLAVGTAAGGRDPGDTRLWGLCSGFVSFFFFSLLTLSFTSVDGCVGSLLNLGDANLLSALG